MTIKRITNSSLEANRVILRPRVTYAVSGSDITGSIPLVPNPSNSIKVAGLHTPDSGPYAGQGIDLVEGLSRIKSRVENNIDDVDALSSHSINGKTVEELRTQLIGKIGENITLRRVKRISAKGNLFSYNHGGRVGVIVDIKSTDENLGKDIAMHIAATKPKALDQSGVSQDLIDAERRVAIEKAKEAGKPEEMLDKIATGTVNKFLKEITLVNQVFVKDEKLTIEQLLKNQYQVLNIEKQFAENITWQIEIDSRQAEQAIDDIHELTHGGVSLKVRKV